MQTRSGYIYTLVYSEKGEASPWSVYPALIEYIPFKGIRTVTFVDDAGAIHHTRESHFSERNSASSFVWAGELNVIKEDLLHDSCRAPLHEYALKRIERMMELGMH